MADPLLWQISTVTAIRAETSEVSSFTLRLPNWRTHRAGQHYDVRLTAADGYQAQRSYSIASPPSRTGEVDLTIERIAGGEVSPYFHDILELGHQVEVRGPIGGYFVWEPALGGPLLLVAGGSGVVPLMAMLRERATADSRPSAVLLYSSRTVDDVIYRDELASLATNDSGLRLIQTLTRSQPAGWTGYDRRIDRPMLTEAIAAAGSQPLVYICGPTLLVEAAANGLVELGVPAAQVRTERFGPTS
ncbi:MAG: ferredoxin reductase [Chloroflexi bacterium]|nr:ferredoxin reductase [Chloroflexota bacterium]